MSHSHVLDVTEETFQVDVIERSQGHAVLVDFWATWCGPCQVLGPILERLAGEYAGAFTLAKVDTDASPNLAAALQIRSVPSVYLFVDGRPVDAFTGALPEREIRDFLAKHVQRGDGDPRVDAEARLAAGDLAGARAGFEKILAADATDEKARLTLARIAFRQGDEAALRTHVEGLPEDSAEARDGARLLEALGFRKECGEGEATWRARLEVDAEDQAGLYGMGCCHAAEGRYEEALEAFLDVVKRDKRWRDEAARKSMLTVFGILGPDSDLPRAYRRQLAIYL